VRADEGEASICGSSVHKDLHSAQQLTGYCPQFDGLPGQMTGASPAINSLQQVVSRAKTFPELMSTAA